MSDNMYYVNLRDWPKEAAQNTAVIQRSPARRFLWPALRDLQLRYSRSKRLKSSRNLCSATSRSVVASTISALA